MFIALTFKHQEGHATCKKILPENLKRFPRQPLGPGLWLWQ